MTFSRITVGLVAVATFMIGFFFRSLVPLSNEPEAPGTSSGIYDESAAIDIDRLDESLELPDAIEAARSLLRSQRLDDQSAFLQIIGHVSPSDWFDFVRSLQETENLQFTSNRLYRAALVARTIRLREPIDLEAFFAQSSNDDYWLVSDILRVVNFQTLFDLLPHLHRHPRAETLFRNALNRVARYDPERAIPFFLENRSRFGGSWEPFFGMLRVIAPDAPEEAIELFYQHIPHEERGNQISRVFSTRFADTDLATSFALTDALRTPDERNRARNSLISTWAQQDPSATLRFLENLPDRGERDRLVRSASWALVRNADSAELVSWAVANTHGHARSNLISNTFNRLAEENPGRAIALLEELPYGTSHSSAVRAIAQTWSQTNSHAALEWATELAGGREREQAINAVLANLGQENPSAAISEILHRFGDNPDNHLRSLGQNLGRMDPETALLAISQLDSDEHYETALRGVLRGWANNDPVAAIRLIDEESLSDIVANDISNIVSRWSNFAPEDAALWVSALEADSSLRNSAVCGLASNWVRHDTYAASEWIASLPPDSTRDSAISSLINTTREFDPEAALLWSLEITNERSRLNHTRQAVNRIDDQAHAHELINQSNLSTEQRAQLIRELNLGN